MTVPTKGPPRPSGGLLALPLIVSLAAIPLVGCGSGEGEGAEDQAPAAHEAEPVSLGPVDGHELPATDLGRVAVGTLAPDFSLQTLAGDTLTLSSFRGTKDVVLVVYRGHW